MQVEGLQVKVLQWDPKYQVEGECERRKLCSKGAPLREEMNGRERQGAVAESSEG